MCMLCVQQMTFLALSAPCVLQSSSNLLLTISALGLLCGVSGMCSLKLPETLGKPLPNTLAEMRRSKSTEAIL